jgi:hypothetical protein
MGILSNLIDSVLQASWKRVGSQRLNDAPLLATSEGPSPHSLNRTFTITEALNGSYITFQKRKYNPNGPDDYRHEVYLVQNGESLIDAISTVLVLTEK